MQKGSNSIAKTMEFHFFHIEPTMCSSLTIATLSNQLGDVIQHTFPAVWSVVLAHLQEAIQTHIYQPFQFEERMDHGI